MITYLNDIRKRKIENKSHLEITYRDLSIMIKKFEKMNHTNPINSLLKSLKGQKLKITMELQK